MADKFYAATKIKFGVRTEDGSQDGKYEQKVFEVDDEVTGLDSATMKELWRNGALRREKGSTGEDTTPVTDGGDGANTGDDAGSGTKPKKAAAPKAPEGPK